MSERGLGSAAAIPSSAESTENEEESAQLKEAASQSGPKLPLLSRSKSKYGRMPTWSTEGATTPLHETTHSPQRYQPTFFLRSNDCWRRYPVIDPTTSCWLSVWDCLTAFFLTVTALLSPYETAFLEVKFDNLFIFGRLVDVVFTIDMCLQFCIASPDPARPERVLKDPYRIVVGYFRCWFWIDGLSLLPVDIVCLLFAQSQSNEGLSLSDLRGVKVIRLIRLVRLLRIARFVRLVDRWHTAFGFSYAKLTLLKFFTTVILCCHWMACIWGGLAMHSFDEHNWLQALCKSKGGPDELYEEPWGIYVLSLYWAIITLTSIGYGDITPQNFLEYWVSAFCTAIMASIWAYVIGAVCGIVSTLEPHEVFFKRTMDDLNWIMADRAMPQSMCASLRKYFHESREMTKHKIENSVLEQMSPLLQGECALFLHLRWINQVWYLRDMNREVIVWAAKNLHLMVFAPNEEVMDTRTLFIIQRGVASYRGKILVSGDIWGEDMLLSNGSLRDQTKVRALSYLSVLSLHIVDLFESVISFPEAKVRLRWAQIRIAAMRGIIRISTVMKDQEAKGRIVIADLTTEQRMTMSEAILAGEFDTHTSGDIFGVEEQTHRCIDRKASISSSVGRLDSDAQGMLLAGKRAGSGSTSGQVLEELVASVQQMQLTLQSISARPSNNNRGISDGSMLAPVQSSHAKDIRSSQVDFGSVASAARAPVGMIMGHVSHIQRRAVDVSSSRFLK